MPQFKDTGNAQSDATRYHLAKEAYYRQLDSKSAQNEGRIAAQIQPQGFPKYVDSGNPKEDAIQFEKAKVEFYHPGASIASRQAELQKDAENARQKAESGIAKPSNAPQIVNTGNAKEDAIRYEKALEENDRLQNGSNSTGKPSSNFKGAGSKATSNH